MTTPPPPGRPAAPPRQGAADARRRRRLARLARDVWDLRPAIAYVQHELQRLEARTRVRPLSRAEAALASVLRRERATLRRRLRGYATEYERLRPRPAAAPGPARRRRPPGGQSGSEAGHRVR